MKRHSKNNVKIVHHTKLVYEIQSRIILSEFVSKYVNLKQKGPEKEGLCPFHDENTPSFRVNDEKGVYHCFGCNASGNLFTFASKMRNMSFYDALLMFAHDLGFIIDKGDVSNASKNTSTNTNTNNDTQYDFTESINELKKHHAKKQNIVEVLNKANECFRRYMNCAAGDMAANYLKGRGVNAHMIREYQIGFCPWNVVAKNLLNKGVSNEELQDSGLFFDNKNTLNQNSISSDENEKQSMFVDKFGGRIIFPIHNDSDDVVGFGARVLPDHMLGMNSNMQIKKIAKYINSAESDVFFKKKLLYGYSQAMKKKKNRDREGLETRTVMVEGYLDVILSNSCESLCAVAPMGTAISVEQIKKAWNLDTCPVIVFDGDTAGKKAADSIIEKILPILHAGVSVSFAMLENKEDPGSVILSNGPEAFQKIVQKAQPLDEYIWYYALRKYPSPHNIITPEIQAAIYDFLERSIRNIGNDSVRMFYKNSFKMRWNKHLFSESKKDGFRCGHGATNNRNSVSRYDYRYDDRYSGDDQEYAKNIHDYENKSKDLQLRMLFSLIIKFPDILDEIQDDFLEIDIADDSFNAMRAKLFEWLSFERENGTENESLRDDLTRFLKKYDNGNAMRKLLFRSMFWHFPARIRNAQIDLDKDDIIAFWYEICKHYMRTVKESQRNRDMDYSARNEFNDNKWQTMRMLYKENLYEKEKEENELYENDDFE